MASPQTENGFTPIANELLEAFCSIRIPGEAGQLALTIVRQTYGFRRKSAEISLDRFVLFTGLKKASIIRGLRRLEKMGIILIYKNANGNIHTYRINKDFESWKPFTKKLIISNIANPDLQKSKSAFTKKLTAIDKETYKETSKETKSSFSLQEKELVREIIADLNAILGTSYRPDSKGTVKHVQLRLKEGWKLEDFRTVVKKKKASWGDDPKMAVYLRPETLFGVKFESYLNEKQKAPVVPAGQRFRG